MTRQTSRKFTRRALPAALALVLAGALSAPAHAVEWRNGDWSVAIDSSISFGATWRMTDNDPADVGKAANNPLVSQLPYPEQVATVGRWGQNDDDPNLIFPDQGDLVSTPLILTSEADITWRNYGAFLRITALYDYEIENNDFISDEAKERVGTDLRLLDAYVWGDHFIGERFLNWRLGRQVVSWGESTFIPGGLNVINRVDVSQLRSAGAELKTAFEGANMIRASFDLTDSLSLEALYLFEWLDVVPEQAGTYFSTSELGTPGSRYVQLGFGLVPQPVINTDLYQDVCFNRNYGASDIGLPPSLVAAGCGVSAPRVADRTPDDQGQYGFALRWFAENLNSTEFGFYYLNYHSRLPLLSGNAVNALPPTIGGPGPVFPASYFLEFPEDIDMFGLSFNTSLGTWSWAGEVSYRPKLPLQADDVELLFAALTPLNPLIPAPVNRYKSQFGEFAPGEEIRGWREQSSWQAQTTFTKLIGPDNFIRANQIAFVAELGVNYVDDLPSFEELRFNGPGTDTGGGADVTSGDFNNPVTEVRGAFADDLSWGYRMLARADYNNAIGAWTVSPRVAWAHDVDGTTPGPGGAFIEDRKILTLGVGFNYLQRWTVDLAYTEYMGGGRFNLLRNRDFFAASVRYAF
jgi:hypothetical protein